MRNGSELAEKCCKWEAELICKDEHNWQQIEVLQSLVQGVNLQTKATNTKTEGEKDVRVLKDTSSYNMLKEAIR